MPQQSERRPVQTAEVVIAEIATFVGATVALDGGDLLVQLAWGDAARIGNIVDENGQTPVRLLIAADGSTIDLGAALLNILPSIEEIVSRPVPVPEEYDEGDGVQDRGARIFARVDFTDFGPVMVPAGPLEAFDGLVAGGDGRGEGLFGDIFRPDEPDLANSGGSSPSITVLAEPGGGVSVFGTPRIDVIEGTGNDDFLFGFDGDDIITGFAGSDVIDGGRGTDLLFPGAGSDFIFDSVAGDVITLGDDHETDFIYLSTAAGFGDLVFDFDTEPARSGGDILSLDQLLIGFSGLTLQDAVDQGYVDFAPTADGTGTLVLIDVDGPGGLPSGDNEPFALAVTLDSIAFTSIGATIAELMDNFAIFNGPVIVV